MPDNHETDSDQTPPQAKRTGREDPNPRNQPEEYVDEMRSNRFVEPPEPEAKPGDDKQ